MRRDGTLVLAARLSELPRAEGQCTAPVVVEVDCGDVLVPEGGWAEEVL